MFKIKNDDEKAKTLERIEAFEKGRKAIEAEKGFDAAMLYARTFQPHVAELQEAVRQYDRLRRAV